MAEETKKTNRRDVLKVLATVPAAAVLPVAAEAQVKAGEHQHSGAHSVHEAAAAPAKAPVHQQKSFTPHEWRTVRLLSDLVIPADDRSGSATQAGVPEYIDEVMLSERGEKLGPEIHGGLAWLDHEAAARFGKDFVDCAHAQQTQILDDIAYPDKTTPHTSQAAHFFSEFRALVAGGFYTSKIGIEDLRYMGNTAVAHWEGCPPEALKKLGLET